MNKGSKVRFRAEAWPIWGANEFNPEMEVIHVADQRTSLRNYVYLGLPWAWQRIEDLELAV